MWMGCAACGRLRHEMGCVKLEGEADCWVMDRLVMGLKEKCVGRFTSIVSIIDGFPRKFRHNRLLFVSFPLSILLLIPRRILNLCRRLPPLLIPKHPDVSIFLGNQLL